MRIAIFGSGSVGGYFGGRLSQAGEDVIFIARGEHLNTMRKDGLRVDSINGDFTVQPVQTTDDPSQIGEVDMVLVGVKAWQVSEAAEAMRPMIGADTLVLPLQNGLRHRPSYPQYWANNMCWAACAVYSVIWQDRGISSMPEQILL